MREKTVELTSLTTGYRHKRRTVTVSESICACIYGGELTCLIGPNGAGKSTLLRTLSGFQPRLGGTITVGGRDIAGLTDKELSRSIGVVLTDRPDSLNMTVLELVCLGRSPYTGFWGVCSPGDIEVAEKAMAMTGITPLRNRTVRTLSDGERQKAMIAKALAQQTPVIFLDEPTAFLDFQSKAELMLMLGDIARETGKTVFMSTHDVDMALQAADTVWLMSRDGDITTGTPGELGANGTLHDFFTGGCVTFDSSSGRLGITRRTPYSGRRK